MPRGIYERKTRLGNRTTSVPVSAAIQAAADQSSYTSNGHGESAGGRIRWTDDEVNAVAAEWVLLRSEDPIAAATALVETAQRKVLPGGRQRDIFSIAANKPLHAAIAKQWSQFVDRPAVQPLPPIEKPAPEPGIITIEVPRKLTAAEMLTHLDEPALEALLSAKRLAREMQHQELLRAIASNAGAGNLPPVTPFVPRFEIFDNGAKKIPRIAVVGLPESRNESLAADTKSAGLDVSLSFPNGKDATTIARCDFAIICREPGKLADPVGDRTVGELGRSRVALLDGSNPVAVLQKIRDFCSR